MVILATIAALTPAFAQSLRFTCDEQGVFPPSLTAEQLERRFGKENVTAGDVDLGEGEKERGTILFPASKNDQVSITWKEKDHQRRPASVRLLIEGTAQSRWRGPLGVSTQVRLKDLEAFNRRPFRIFGFGWDYSGSVASWADGLLDQLANSPCRFIVRMNPEEGADIALQNTVMGDREYSSGHPSMQRLNPKAYEFLLVYP